MLIAEIQEEKQPIRERKELLLEKQKSTLSALEFRQNWETHKIQLEARFVQRKGGLILLEKDADNVTKFFFIIFVTAVNSKAWITVTEWLCWAEFARGKG